MSPDAKAFVSKAIAARRHVARWSQAELAEKCGVTRQMIDRLERGQVTPSLRTLEALAAAFDIAPSELLP